MTSVSGSLKCSRAAASSSLRSTTGPWSPPCEALSLENTPDKPDISVVDYEPDNTVSSFLNVRVADIRRATSSGDRGGRVVTPPIDRGAEIRCYMRDPDGYLIEVGVSSDAAA